MDTMEDNFPITNNPKIIFIPNKTDSSSSKKSRLDDLYGNGNNTAIKEDVCEENSGFGDKMNDLFLSSYLYCVILGSISLMSGLLLSVIAFHGLNSSNITPIMGRAKKL